jgi:hypothetical protein
VWSIGRILAIFRSTENDPDQHPAPELGTSCRDWRQGDVFRDANTFVFDHNWAPQLVRTTHGAVVVSQSCDASLPHRERIQIAPLVRLEDADDVREALSGVRTQYVAVPRLGPDFFVDLDGITTVAKTALVSCERVAGVKSDKEVREFAFSVSRRYGRFAYADEVVACLNPLTTALKAKARKEQSPLGQALASVHSIRVQCADWTRTPYQLTLIVIVEADVVPSDPDDIGQPPRDLDAPSSANLKTQINRYVSYLGESGRSQSERYFAWQYLADIWARQCEAAAQSMGLTGFVSSVTAELTAVDDFPLSRVLRTESLDLDYLSDSRKPMV